MSITKERKDELMKSYQLKDSDTGSVEVQCAVLTERILNLTEHFRGNKQDFQSRRGLLFLVYRRKRLLSYLKRKDEKRYKDLVVNLGLRK